MNLKETGRNRRNTFLHCISTQISLDPHHRLHVLFSCILDMDTLGDYIVLYIIYYIDLYSLLYIVYNIVALFCTNKYPLSGPGFALIL